MITTKEQKEPTEKYFTIEDLIRWLKIGKRTVYQKLSTHPTATISSLNASKSGCIAKHVKLGVGIWLRPHFCMLTPYFQRVSQTQKEQGKPDPQSLRNDS